jgi:predicted O-methyltransferase YrrM
MNVKINEPQQSGKDLQEKALHEEMQERLLPGMPYLAWLQWFHRTCNPRNYLEIGVNTGRSLQFALHNTKCVGVDPNPVLEYALTENQSVITADSDAFFAKNNVEELLGDKIELAFIDGLHHYDQVLKDFINVEKHSDKDTIVLLHDIYPVVPETATREWNTFYWAGDTWKFMHVLKTYRPDLTVRTIPTFPTGLGFVHNLDANNTTLEDNFETILAEFDNKIYDLNNSVNLVENNPEEIIKCLS